MSNANNPNAYLWRKALEKIGANIDGKLTIEQAQEIAFRALYPEKFDESPLPDEAEYWRNRP